MLVPFTAMIAEPVRPSDSVRSSAVSGLSLRLSFIGSPGVVRFAPRSLDAKRDLFGGAPLAQIVRDLHPEPVRAPAPVLQRQSVPLHLAALAGQADRPAERLEFQAARSVVLGGEEPVLDVQIGPPVDGIVVRAVDLVVEGEFVA